MGGVLEIATSVSTPIAVTGLIVGVLLIVFRQVLNLEIFPKLNKALGADLIGTILRYLYRLTMVALVLGFLGYIAPIVLAAFINRYPPPNYSITVDLPDDRTLKQSIEILADMDNRTVSFRSDCKGSFMNAKVRGGAIQGNNKIDLINQLRYRLKEPAPVASYKVILTEGGIYEVICDK